MIRFAERSSWAGINRYAPRWLAGLGAVGKVWDRLRADIHLAIITGFAVCGALGILPFLVMRFSDGEYLPGVIDLAIVLGILGLVIFAWVTGRTALAGCVIVLMTTLSCIVLAPIIGEAAVGWAYTVEVAALLVAPRRFALIANTVLIAGLSVQSTLFDSPLAVGSFIATGALVTLYSFIFAMITAHQQRQLELQAAYDPLTGIANRRTMDTDLAALADGTGVTMVPSALAVLDVDHFKAVNDRYGHKAGDRVLLELTRLVAQSIRNGDRFYRLGGEEFVLLMPATDDAGMRIVVERLHAYLGRYLYGPDKPQRVSIGAATRRDGETPAAWIARADAALYQAKATGRNRIVYAPQATRETSDTGTSRTPGEFPRIPLNPPAAVPRQ